MGLVDVAHRVEAISAPIAESLGLEIVMVQYRQEGGRWILRVLADRPGGGITIDECGQLSRELSDVLDVEDFLDARYNLEVSSPGVNRPLVKLDHFRKVVGQEISLRTHAPVSGRKKFQGVLGAVDEESIQLTSDGAEVAVPFSQIERANLVPAWDIEHPRKGR